jgi:hypothetical protein
MTETDRKTSILPEKLIITLRAGGAFFALANVICVAILAWTYVTVKLEPKVLAVTGSARKAIVSDLVTWEGTISVKSPDLVKAYDDLKVNADKVKAFLITNGVPESDITFSAITTSRRFKQEIVTTPRPASGDITSTTSSTWPASSSGSSTWPTSPYGTGESSSIEFGGRPGQAIIITTDQVEMYTLAQTISISSSEVVKVPEVSRTITSLIKDGVEIDSGSLRFLYTKLAELKINMLAEATKDATLRAEQIVNNANGHLGKLVEARMGVMQINEKGYTATSGEGINDTSSYEKEITAIVSVKFEVR